MIHILFENPFWLAFSLMPVLFVLWGVWNRTRTRLAGRALIAGLVVCPLLFVVQRWVVTDREALQRVTHQVSEATQRGEVKAVMDLVDPAAQFGSDYDRDDFEEHLNYLLKKYTIINPVVYGFTIEIAGGRATVRCSARCTVRTSSWTYTVPSSWKLSFVLKQDRWLITDVRPLAIAGREYSSIFEVD